MSHDPSHLRAIPSRLRTRSVTALATVLAVFSVSSVTHAEAGTHAPAISTWDTRASSVVVGFRPGFLSGGHFDIVSYNANFTATNGNLSSQFGVHYMNVREGAGQSIEHGLGATAVALFSIPALPRYDSGTPKLAVGLYVGAAPTALVSGRSSFISIPFLLGAGLPYSPHPSVTLTPWFEASPGVNLDTRVKTSTFANPDFVPNADGSVTLTDSTIRNIINQAVDFKVSGTVGLRTGLDLAFKLGDSVDLNINAMLGSLGGGFGGTLVGWIGGGLAFRWDEVVPAVLPPEKRLLHEDCADIEARHRACMTTQEPGMTPVTPAPTPAPTSFAPAPANPAPYVPPAPAPAPAATTPARSFPPPPPPPPPPPTGSTPSGSGIPTTGFPQ